MPGVNGDAGAEAVVTNGRNGGAVEGAAPAARKTKVRLVVGVFVVTCHTQRHHDLVRD